MPELKPVGEAQEEREPVTIPIVGRDSKGSPVTIKIRFWGDAPFGTNDDMIAAILPNGRILSTPARVYIEQCVLPDDRGKWDELIHGASVLVEQSTLLEVYTSLTTYYTERPTKQPPASHSGQSSIKRTSRAAASVKKSTAKR